MTSKPPQNFLVTADAAKSADSNGHVTPSRDETPIYIAGDQVGDARGHAFAAAALRDECEIVTSAVEGVRNDTLNVSVFKVARFVTEGILTEDEVTAALKNAAQRAGLDDDEIDATIASGFKGRKKKPPTNPVIPPQTDNVIEVDAAALQKPVPADKLAHIENGFWDTRESLHTIYSTALTRMCSPWTVLACCAARALHFVRPCVYLPPLIGGRGSLNWFAAIAAPSGGGKGSSLAVARDLVADHVYQRNLGSGEGLVTAFQTKNGDDTREAVMFVADELDNMTALGARTGATLMPVLRSAFSGETLGFSYATKGRDIHLEAHTYRLTLICSVQPGRAGALLADDVGGTPQRFMWFPGLDHRITRRDNYDFTPTLTLPKLTEWLHTREIDMPQQAKDMIIDERVHAMTGEGNTLDAHAAFAREKFAFALAVLDNRTEITLEDWQLSGTAAAVSVMTRDWITTQVRSAEDHEHVKRGRAKAVEVLATEDEKTRRIYARAEHVRKIRASMASRILERLADGPVTKRDLDRAMSTNKNREMFKSVMKELYDHHKIGWDKEGLAWFLR